MSVNASGDLRAPALRLGSLAPNFTAETTEGTIDFHRWMGSSWTLFFSHPEDYTPVCTTELAALAKLEPEFAKRNVKLIGLSANTIDSHGGWILDINDIFGSRVTYPIIGDSDRKIAYLYDMLDHQDGTNVDSHGMAFTIRSVFIIDPTKTIRAIQCYPASTGRSTQELLRIIDSLQTYDRYRVETPADWRMGDDVIVHHSITNEEARKVYDGLRIERPYLRFVKYPGIANGTMIKT
ncbi:thioredoxin-like protein [Xylogone sp. PMI_703]|nr:thioredoxin-like protein [Xylogone sp. PMI_703]